MKTSILRQLLVLCGSRRHFLTIRVGPFVFANLSSFVAFVSARANASVQSRLRISLHVSCARRSCISGHYEFSSWCPATKERRAGKETQTGSFFDSYASASRCFLHRSGHVGCIFRVVPSLGRIALVTYLVFGTEFWFDFLDRV